MSESIIGQTMPTLEFAAHRGETISSPNDFTQKWTVLYFYPKDDTPGCTKQACGYRDAIEEFKKIEAQIVGVSSDSVDSHDQFSQKFSLNFPLIADTENKLRNFLGVQSRDTFLINPDGKIEKVWRAVNPVDTVEETRLAITAMQSL